MYTTAYARFSHLADIEEAPLTIHLKCHTLEMLLRDTHYRNQFETNTSNGRLTHPDRRVWENSLFNNMYELSSGFDRVKYPKTFTVVFHLTIRIYGVLNCFRQPYGRAPEQYGYSILSFLPLTCH